MSIYLNILGFHIPSYGLMITLGVILANVFALYPLKKYKLIFDDFLILEAYTLLGAFIGAKLLYLIISYREIDWSRFLEPRYFNYIMSSGFVFYGGLIGGLLCFLFAGKFHHINSKPYITHLIYLIPWIHGFGRIGCFLAGCCYGTPCCTVSGRLSGTIGYNTVSGSVSRSNLSSDSCDCTCCAGFKEILSPYHCRLFHRLWYSPVPVRICALRCRPRPSFSTLHFPVD